MHQLKIKTLNNENDIIIKSDYIKFQKDRHSGEIKEIIEIGFETIQLFESIDVTKLDQLSEFEILTIELDNLLIYENKETNHVVKSCFESTEGIISKSESKLAYYLNIVLELLKIG